MRKTLISAIVLGSLTLSGCGVQPDAAPVPSESVTSSSTPTAQVTPEPTKPTIEELVVGPEGLGPLRVGEAPPVTDPAVDILVFYPDGCNFVPDLELFGPRDDYGIWVSNYGVDPVENLAGPFGVLVEGGVIEIIGIYDESIATAEGAHLGMTRDDLLAVYPTSLELETADAGLDAYRLRGTTGDLIFSLWPDQLGEWTVRQINVSYPGFRVPLGGSDFGTWGICYGA